MATLQPVTKYVPPKLDTLPPEIRAVIYAHVSDPLALSVSVLGELNLEQYPWQLSAVSRLIRAETLPILLGNDPSRPLHLLCDRGRFPDEIRRRIPNRVLWGISTIVITDRLQYDDLKPSIRDFPKLRELWLSLRCEGAPPLFSYAWETGAIRPPYSSEDLDELMSEFKRKRIHRVVSEMKRQQEMPREGLERDYIVDGTLYDVLSMDRKSRGFEVKLEAYLFATMTRIGFIGVLNMNSWDDNKVTIVEDPTCCRWLSGRPVLPCFWSTHPP